MKKFIRYGQKIFLFTILGGYSLFLSSSTYRPNITLMFLGDVMLGRHVASQHHHTQTWNTALLWLGPYDKQVDMVLANLESPIALPYHTDYSPPIDLRAPASALQIFNRYEMTLLSIANNHIHDEGFDGAKYTEQKIFEAGNYPIGLSHQPLFIEKKGYSLAFFAWDDVLQSIDIESAAQQVRKAHLSGYWVVVSIHWGAEYSLGITPRQKKLAQAFADAGADFLWGHHPHVLQPLDCILGKNQKRPLIVAYSLGNALFDQMVPPDTKIGSAVLITLKNHRIHELAIIPFQINPIKAVISTPTKEQERKAYDQLTYFIADHENSCNLPIRLISHYKQ